MNYLKNMNDIITELIWVICTIFLTWFKIINDISYIQDRYIIDLYHVYIQIADLLLEALLWLPVAIHWDVLGLCNLRHCLWNCMTLTLIWKGCKELWQAPALVVNFLGQTGHKSFHQLFPIRKLKVSSIMLVWCTVIGDVQWIGWRMWGMCTSKTWTKTLLFKIATSVNRNFQVSWRCQQQHSHQWGYSEAF